MTVFSWTTSKTPVKTKAQIEAEALQEAARKAALAKRTANTAIKSSTVSTPVKSIPTAKELGTPAIVAKPTAPGAVALAPSAPRSPTDTSKTPVAPGSEVPTDIKEPVAGRTRRPDPVSEAIRKATEEKIRLGAELGAPGPGATGGYGVEAKPPITPIDTSKTPVTPGEEMPPKIKEPIATGAVGVGLEEISPVPSPQEQELEALRQQFAAQLAQDLLTSRARSGLAGMALSGAAQGAESDIRAKAARGEALTLADVTRGYRGETREEQRIAIEKAQQEAAAQQAAAETELARQQSERESKAFDLAMLELEKEMGTDLNGDGLIGTGTAARSPEETAAQQARIDMESISATMGGKGERGDPYGGLYGAGEGKLTALVAAGAEFTIVTTEDWGPGTVVIAQDQYGNYYKFVPPAEINRDPEKVMRWFRSIAGQ
ncbi:MAG TPA: hypothetical protein VJ327_11285 [Patescibacteria group bacterium]|nr:hypothetical protein [Patescibacteria group bacterium]